MHTMNVVDGALLPFFSVFVVRTWTQHTPFPIFTWSIPQTAMWVSTAFHGRYKRESPSVLSITCVRWSILRGVWYAIKRKSFRTWVVFVWERQRGKILEHPFRLQLHSSTARRFCTLILSWMSANSNRCSIYPTIGACESCTGRKATSLMCTLRRSRISTRGSGWRRRSFWRARESIAGMLL